MHKRNTLFSALLLSLTCSPASARALQEILNDGTLRVGEIVFANLDPIPSDLTFSSTATLVLQTIGATAQGAVTATYPKRRIGDDYLIEGFLSNVHRSD